MDMKHSVMTWRKETRLSPVPPPDGGPEGRGGSAFDLWLRRGLHQLFDDVAKEPVPEELLRLIEDDRALKPNGASSAPDVGTIPPSAGASPDAVSTGASKKGAGAEADRPATVHRTRGTGQ